MMLELLFSAPMLALAWIAAILIALTVHEFAHALVGKMLGDDTAEQMGRLTLNPFAHLDPIGFLMLLALGFGWAKPVPYDPRKLFGSKYDAVFIAFAGPLSNLVLAVIGAFLFRGAVVAGIHIVGTVLAPFLIFFVLINFMLALFNLIPIHPLDGSKLITVLFAKTRLEPISLWLLRYGNQMLFGLILVSILTSINVFVFIQVPSFIFCDYTLGVSCGGLLGVYFGG